MSRYDDIIHLPHHVSQKRARMSNYDRAAQFSPFAALVGYDAAIGEAGRLTESPATLTQSAVEEINAVLCQIHAKLPEPVVVRLTYFCPDGRKAGGARVSVTALARKMDFHRQILWLDQGREVAMNAIEELEILDTAGEYVKI